MGELIDIDGYGVYDTEYSELHRGVYDEDWDARVAADECNIRARKWNSDKEEYEEEVPQRYVAVKVTIKEL